MEEALFLTNFASEVVVVHRRDELRASKIMQQRAFDNDKVHFAWNSVVTEILGSRDGGVTGVMLEDTESGDVREYPTGGVFIAIGHQPNTAIFEGKLDMDEVGYIRTVPGTTRTSVEGVCAGIGWLSVDMTSATSVSSSPVNNRDRYREPTYRLSRSTTKIESVPSDISPRARRSETTFSIPSLSMVRSPLWETRSLMKRCSLSSQKRCVCRFGRNRRRVLRCEWETLFPVIGRLPVTWHTLDMTKSLI